jgi:hypothetical protein
LDGDLECCLQRVSFFVFVFSRDQTRSDLLFAFTGACIVKEATRKEVH